MGVENIKCFIDKVKEVTGECKKNLPIMRKLQRVEGYIRQIEESGGESSAIYDRKMSQILDKITQIKAIFTDRGLADFVNQLDEMLCLGDASAEASTKSRVSSSGTLAKVEKRKVTDYYDNTETRVTLSNQNVGQVLKHSSYRPLVCGTVSSPVGQFLLEKIEDEKSRKGFLIYGTKYGQRLLLQMKLSMQTHIEAVGYQDSEGLAQMVCSDFSREAFKSIEKTQFSQVSNYWLNGYNEKIGGLLPAKSKKKSTVVESKEAVSVSSAAALTSSSVDEAESCGKVPICTTELRYLFREWDRFQHAVKFTNVESDSANQMEFVDPPWVECSHKAQRSWALYAIHLVEKLIESTQKSGDSIRHVQSTMIECFHRDSYADVITMFHRLAPGQKRLDAHLGMAYCYPTFQHHAASSSRNGSMKRSSNRESKSTGRQSKKNASARRVSIASLDPGQCFRQRFFTTLNQQFSEGKTDLMAQLQRPGCQRKLRADLHDLKLRNRAAERYVVARMCKALLEEALDLSMPVLYTLQGINIEAVAGANPMVVKFVDEMQIPFRDPTSCKPQVRAGGLFLGRLPPMQESKRQSQTDDASKQPHNNDSLLVTQGGSTTVTTSAEGVSVSLKQVGGSSL